MTVGRLALASIVGTAVVCGLAAGYLLAPRQNPLPGVAQETQAQGSGSFRERVAVARTDAPTAADFQALSRALDEERALREALEAEVARLLESPHIEPATSAGSTEPEMTASVQLAPASPHPTVPGVQAPAQPTEWFDRAGLAKAGLSSSEIREIEERWEENEMQKLYLTDKATREGTNQTREFYEQLRDLNRGVIDDLGPEGYDAFLFASGRPNRVVLGHVLENSPAGYAGLQAGDVVVRYGDERVFHSIDFKAATNQGEVGTATSVEVLRDGQVHYFSVPRGPLGVQLKPLIARPDKNL